MENFIIEMWHISAAKIITGESNEKTVFGISVFHFDYCCTVIGV